MKVGIFFGGQSREREVSFAGGRTVYDNLDKSIFTPVPIFVDSLGNFILLNWEFLYKGTIRDFYPPVAYTPPSAHGFQIYVESIEGLTPDTMEALIASVGKKINPESFKDLFDIAFLALHGPFGEDGNIQGLLEWYGIPYTGSGILSSAIGIDKHLQKQLFASMGFPGPAYWSITKTEWATRSAQSIFEEASQRLGTPFVVKAIHQGSSIGVTIVDNASAMRKAIHRSLFIEEIEATDWQYASPEEKTNLLHDIIDIRQGIGLPVWFLTSANPQQIAHPDDLWAALDQHFAQSQETVVLETVLGEYAVLFEELIRGKEFSCIVIENEHGKPVALPPTEIVKGDAANQDDVFDYRSKYLPGMVHKITPIRLETPKVRKIQEACCQLFTAMHFGVYARIDGFITSDDTVVLNDPNTTSGMLPSSFFFHQSAEIGMNPSQFLTYIIRTSLVNRLHSGKHNHSVQDLLTSLDHTIAQQHAKDTTKTKVAVIMGGYSAERHISVESGRNIYEKLSSSEKYEPIPVFLTDNEAKHELFIIPINILLKDNADDIKHKIYHALAHPGHEVIQEIIADTQGITQKYVGQAVFTPTPLSYAELAELVDFAFIALHGRPGEDGAVQQELEKYKIPYNGSGVESSQITIDKYKTNALLRQHDILVAEHLMAYRTDWLADSEAFFQKIEMAIPYPIIAKPSDDGCSAAVKKIRNRKELQAFTEIMFRAEHAIPAPQAAILQLKKNEEFPQKDYFLVESLISANGATRFLEITGGMLTHRVGDTLRYEVFAPSEALATSDILSLEEKFLAGEGQNITPARFSSNLEQNASVMQQVQAELEKVARILQVEGYCRIDAFVRIFANGTVETIIIEVNSLPGMTPATCIFHQSAINGYKPYQFIDQIIEYGIQKAKAVQPSVKMEG